MTERSSTDANESRAAFLDDAELAEAIGRAESGLGSLRRELAGIRGDDPPEILCATKTVDVRVINHLIESCSLTLIGENRVQELLMKWPYLSRDGVSVHFIGNLQTNKVKYIIDKVDMIESCSSLTLAKEISRQAEKRGIVMDVLAECNIGREDNKSGVMPEDMADFCGEIARLPGVRLRGVMTMAPRFPEEEKYREYFRKTYEIFVDISAKIAHNNSAPDPVLSMGMSESWRVAAECGSTEIRVGTAVFGARRYPPQAVQQSD